MKKYIFILTVMVLLPVLLSAQSNNEYFYYYKGEKQYLELNTDYVYISTDEGRMSQKYIDLFDAKSSFKEDKLFETSKFKNENVAKYWAEMELDKNLSKSDYLKLIKSLSIEKNIQTVSPYFKSKDAKKIGLSNFFYVKLRHLSDTISLNRFASKYSCIVVKQDKFMPLWFLLSVTKKSNRNALDVANMFYESKLFEYAEPDLMTDDIFTCKNDEFFSNQWSLKNSGQNGGTFGIDINACKAWDMSKGANVTVAVIDQGIELNHPDLQANIHPSSYDTETNSSPSIVRGSHGTACAGILGADDNNIGISGVAPDCRLMSISSSVLVNRTTSMRLGQGINWAVANGADVISNSWFNVQSNILDDAITNALTNGRNGLGCVVVFATGNDNGSVNYPANSNSRILSVGAISSNGNRASFSNHGSQLDVVAPGVDIYTTDRQGRAGYNHSNGTNGNYHSSFRGTSAACPHVAGVAALILSIRPNLTGKQVRDVIEKSARKVGGYSYTTHSNKPNGTWNNEMGYGLVDAYAAVNSVAPKITGPTTVCNASTTFTLHNRPPNTTVTWSQSPNLNQDIRQGNDYTVKPINNTAQGNGFVKATVSYSVNGTQQQIEVIKNVWVGKPSPVTGLSHVTIFGCTEGEITADSEGELDQYEWVILGGRVVDPPNPSSNRYIGGGSVVVDPVDGPYGFTVKIRAINSCGHSPWYIKHIPTDCSEGGGQITPRSAMAKGLSFPNPASGIVFINLAPLAKNKKEFNAQISLFDFNGELVFENKTNIILTQIDVSAFKNGTYILRVSNGEKTITEKLVIQN